MNLNDVKDYLNSKCFKPYFKYVDNSNYMKLLDEIGSVGHLSFIHLSDFCREEDRRPDLDKLRSKLREIDVDYDSNQCVLLGLGEYLSMEGTQKAQKVLSEFLSFNLGTAQLVIICRGLKNELTELLSYNLKNSMQISIDCDSVSTFTLSLSPLGIGKINGFKNLLKAIETSADTEYSAMTKLEFPRSSLSINYINNYKEALLSKYVMLNKVSDNEDYWKLLWNDLQEKHSINSVFNKYGFSSVIDEDFYARISTKKYENWLFFEYLKRNLDSITNMYLREVIYNTADYSLLRINILKHILSISHKDEKFVKYYSERKKCLKYYTDQEVAVFVNENRQDIEESIYRLTDVKKVERQEIIAYIGQHGIPNCLSRVYPDLDDYLQDYHFSDTTIKDELTEYFAEYKKLKVTNIITPDFQELVNNYAKSKIYNRLPSRNEFVMETEKTGSFLCWIDALGVEYIGYISKLAKKYGLRCTIKIGRAELPSITPINKEFYDSWDTGMKRKIEELDDLKHHDKGGYIYGPSNLYPIHLSDELEVIKNAILDAATELSQSRCKKYVIASDHGASRLAVIARQEVPYDTDTKGEHSGRCCKYFDGYDLAYSTEDYGYIILSDYGRFRGSRAANVEVHGGATLEEVVVPYIILSLNDTSIEFKLGSKKVYADRKTGIDLILFVNGYIDGKIFVDYNGEKYYGERVDDTHWSFKINAIKKAGTYNFNIFVGDDLVSGMEVQVAGKMASINDDFDDLV